MAQVQRKTFSLEEAACHLSVSRRSVERLITNGSIATFKVGNRRLVEVKEIDRLVAERASA